MTGRRAVAALATVAALAGAVLGAGALAPAAAAAAEGKTRTVTLRSAPFRLSGFETRTPKVWVRTPRRTGYVTGFRARLVDVRGRPIGIDRVMLHHVVFLNHGRSRRTSCGGRRGEPFWGTGEEHQTLRLPAGYGYRVRAEERWRMQVMLMNHALARQRVRVEYRVQVVTGRRLEPVKPLWWRANGCNGTSYDVTGGLAPGQPHVARHDWKAPFDARIVAAGGHLHGSALNMTVTQPRCGNRELVRHDPLYGRPDDRVYTLEPVLHEPGPIATGYFLSAAGVPVRRGEPLRVTGVYDGTRPHPGVMAITHVYLARERRGERPTQACPPLPADRRTVWERTDGVRTPPVVRMPLYGIGDGGAIGRIERPPGSERVIDRDRVRIDVRSTFRPANLSVPRGAEVTWRFPERHNVLVADGPRLVASGTRSGGGTYRRRLDAPGTYKLFCSLHPVTMQQVIRVRE